MHRFRQSKRSARFIVGLMSGTSADGIDAVAVEISGRGRHLRARVVAHTHRSFPPILRRRILDACLHGTVAEICELNFLLGEHFARAALGAIRRAHLKPADIAAIGSHGQTVHHLPNARTPSTLQIGESAVIAERTGITTIADFRVRDMAAGGQGAPLVPYADWALFTDERRPRIVQNLGGIGNLTFLPPRAGLQDVVAFDTGPGNMVMDGLMAELTRGRQTFDQDGRWAARGQVSEKLLAEMMAHPFLRRRPPKTTGREEFGEAFVRRVLGLARRLRLRPEDTLATATAFTAASVADAYRRFVFPRLKTSELGRLQVVLGGGGARNPTLRSMLARRIGVGELLTHEDFGIANAAKEALAFAILAHETLRGKPGNVPSATGARRAAVLGQIVPGAG
ncbi:MAG TPA: anhydro-N-acetylmuramic acid kinase [Verrucomicrobiota bacterium]|nr:anhydro-N-acetylmuramic acid kinase [Verrucomicrobiota bacterium]HQL77677.1 anhydro-N-acetylmuramic acid kinase [Verrucomicrobiota bacterium]